MPLPLPSLLPFPLAVRFIRPGVADPRLFCAWCTGCRAWCSPNSRLRIARAPQCTHCTEQSLSTPPQQCWTPPSASLHAETQTPPGDFSMRWQRYVLLVPRPPISASGHTSARSPHHHEPRIIPLCPLTSRHPAILCVGVRAYHRARDWRHASVHYACQLAFPPLNSMAGAHCLPLTRPRQPAKSSSGGSTLNWPDGV